MSRIKPSTLIPLNLLLILTMLAMACNLGSTAPTQPPPTQEVAPTEPVPTQPSPPTTIPTEGMPAGYIPDSRWLSLASTLPPSRYPAMPPGWTAPLPGRASTTPSCSPTEQLAALQQNGFVVSPGSELEFFTVYEKARYANLPIFVTSDALLHSYHLLFDKVLRTAETEQFIPLLRSLNAAMLAKSDEIYQAAAGTDWETDALRLVAFFGVGSQLLDPTVQVPPYAQELVTAELANVNAAAGMLASPIFPSLVYGEDYTQYIPRGHYTRSEELSAYFKSMMWYGRMTFILKGLDPEAARGDTRCRRAAGLRHPQRRGGRRPRRRCLDQPVQPDRLLRRSL